ncbi:glycosyl transferase family 1 [Veillonella denticariosi JCM 15641]|uniref:Glycosyl transferase family 1 n=1 Tax=Veillonella denticariosi JCM 15641 TaxID=1298594 RepID=A0A2S7ZAV6_9FIRM|nr:glycosyl transferase family 1 [Veillonella denticariosi]PQL20392.1 glycosyl transferase family 1 [Veillonella denticariosi JCM 15641]
MRVAILESIIMPAGHEVEFDRIIINELKRQGHEPVLMVPENFKFKVDYGVDVIYLDGGEVVTYAGAAKWKKPFLSLLREKRRRAWFRAAARKLTDHNCDALIIPTATYRYVKALLDTSLKNAAVPIHLIFHGIGKGENRRFLTQAERAGRYENIYLDVITLRDDMLRSDLPRVRAVAPPVFTPSIEERQAFTIHHPLRLGFFGQFRKEKNIIPLLDAFKGATFKGPVELLVQGATAKPEDGELFDSIARSYADVEGLTFLHANLIGPEWDRALLDVDAILMPYGAERYRYHWSAMLFTAIGFNKPVLVSPEINPEVLQQYRVGESIDVSDVDTIRRGLERFVNQMIENPSVYQEGLQRANETYSHRRMIQSMLET